MVRKINRVVKNFLSISFANISSQVFTFLVVAYYARILGSSLFGDISTVQAVIVYFTMFVMLGLQTYGTREISKSEKYLENIVGNILILRIMAFILSYSIIIVYTLIDHNNVAFNKLLLLYGIILLPTAFNLEWVFSGLQEMQHNAIYNLVKNLLPSLLIILFLKNKEQFYVIPIFTIIGLVAALCYHFYIYFIKRNHKVSFIIKCHSLKRYLKYGYPFMLSGVLATLNGNVDRIVIKFTRGSAEAGVYYSGYSIIIFLTSIITLLFTPVFPLFIKYFHEKKFDKLTTVINNIVKVIAVISLPIFAGGILLSRDIILLLFGREYVNAYFSFAILMGYILILFIREIYAYCLNSWNKEKIYLKIVFISSMINLFFNMIFTPLYGMNIAAVITVLSEVINLLLMRKYTQKILRFEVFRYFGKTIIPTIIMSLSIFLIKYFNLHILINIFTAIVVYFTAILLLKVITIRDIKMALFKKEGSI
jgi:O-antigen/teichoic acid export membrane protein